MTGTNVVRHVIKIWPNDLLISAYIQNLAQRPIKILHICKMWPNDLSNFRMYATIGQTMYQFSAHMQSLAKRLIKFLNIFRIRPNDASNAFKTVPGDLQDRSRMDSLSRFIFKSMHDENEGGASKAEHPRSPHEPPTMFPRRIQGAPKKPSQNALIETAFLLGLGVPKKHTRRPQNASTANLHICRKEPAYMQKKSLHICKIAM